MSKARTKNGLPHPLVSRFPVRRGSALLLVLVVVSMLALATLSFSSLMFLHYKAARVAGRIVQARALAESGRAYVSRLLAEDPERLQEAGGLYDNTDLFRGVLVVDDAAAEERGRFSVLAPSMEDGIVAGTRFGLEDESARLNLNLLLTAEKRQEGAGRKILMGLPGMTEDVADAILDWLDEDSEPRQYGAESDYYSGLSPPYGPKNGPLDSIEELLLVRGVTTELLFGPDLNRNGTVEPGEAARDSTAGYDNSNGEMNCGWAGYLTLLSAEHNVQPDGTPRIDLNSDDLKTLHADLTAALGEEMANIIVAYRQYGPHSGGGKVQPLSVNDLDLTKPGAVHLTTVLDLIGHRVRVRRSTGETLVAETPFPDEPVAMTTYLPLLMDHVTINPEPTIPARINVNHASKVILAGVPGMTEELVAQILAARTPEPTAEHEGRRYETWLLAEGMVDLPKMKELMPFLTGGGSVYRAQIVGFFDGGGVTTRLEAIWDATSADVRLVSWRDMTQLGRGYSPEALGAVTTETK